MDFAIAPAHEPAAFAYFSLGESKRSWRRECLLAGTLGVAASLAILSAAALRNTARVVSDSAWLDASPDALDASPFAPSDPFLGMTDHRRTPHPFTLVNDVVTDGFFRVLWRDGHGRGPAEIWLEVNQSALGSEFLVSAIVSRGDGRHSLLHEDRTDAERTVFKFEQSPGVDSSLDLIAPQYEIRLPAAGGSLSQHTLTHAAWSGYVESFVGTKVTRFITKPNASDERSSEACDAILWRNGSEVPVSPLGCERYAADGTSWLIDVTKWLTTGVVTRRLASGEGQRRPRLVLAEAHPASAVFGLQTREEELRLSLARLPPLDGRYTARAADDRIGYWTLEYTEVGEALGPLTAGSADRKVDVIQRWHLQPSDPHVDAAEERAAGRLLTPSRPITFYIDPSVPERWRRAMKRGVENWQAAFEQAGWANAIVAVLPGDEAFPSDYSAADSRYAAISWAVSLQEVYSVGTHTFDPRTGEIMDADIMFSHSWVSAWANDFDADAAGAPARTGTGAGGSDNGSPHRHHGKVYEESGGYLPQRYWHGQAASERLSHRLAAAERRIEAALGERHGDPRGQPGPCGVSSAAARREGMANLRAKLELDGAIPPGGRVPEEYIEAALVDVTMHEVGHTLGLRHNFRASAAYSFSQLSDPSFTEAHGYASSVMDYVDAFLPSSRNLSVIGSSTGAVYNPFNGVVGIYDRHAIEYGYAPLAGEEAGRQHAYLAALASRGAANAELAFSTDEDEATASGPDPLVSLYDQSNDPLGFYIDQLALSQRLLSAAANRTVGVGEPWAALLPSVERYMGAAMKAGAAAAKYVGGYVFSKAHKGDPAAPPPLVPVSAAEQWRAVQLLLQILSDDFWVPQEELLVLPERRGECHGLDVYCLGLGVAKLQDKAHETRTLLLQTLVKPARLASLRQGERTVVGGAAVATRCLGWSGGCDCLTP